MRKTKRKRILAMVLAGLMLFSTGFSNSIPVYAQTLPNVVTETEQDPTAIEVNETNVVISEDETQLAEETSEETVAETETETETEGETETETKIEAETTAPEDDIETETEMEAESSETETGETETGTETESQPSTEGETESETDPTAEGQVDPGNETTPEAPLPEETPEETLPEETEEVTEETKEIGESAGANEIIDTPDLDTIAEEIAFVQSLPQTYWEMKGQPQEWWDSLLPNQYEEAQKWLRYLELTLDSSNGISLMAAFNPEAYDGEQYAQLVITRQYLGQGAESICEKTLGGALAFCADQKREFATSGTNSYYFECDSSTYTGPAAWVVNAYGPAVVGDETLFGPFQLTIWALMQGITTPSDLELFCEEYLKSKITNEDEYLENYHNYVDGVKSTVSAALNHPDETCQIWNPTNDNYQRMLVPYDQTPNLSTYTYDGGDEPGPGPTPVEPEYADVSANASRTASRTHEIIINSKYANITGENLSGAVFEVSENGQVKGTITTNENGYGSLSWTISETRTSSSTKTYCGNYDQLDAETQATVTGYTNRDDAYNAALREAESAAQSAADAAANASRSVTVREITVPYGFNATDDSTQNTSLAGNASHTFRVSDQPWKAKVELDKVDGITGSRLTQEATFAIYEWDKTAGSYAVSPNYSVIRLEDGTYTVQANYADAETGYVYYTQKNEGKFYIQEVKAPEGYLTDSDPVYFQITADNQTFVIGNNHPENYEINDGTKFANQPSHIYIRIPKIDRYSGNMITEDASFTLFCHYGTFTKPVTFTKQEDGSYLSNEVYYADTFDNANYGKFYLTETEAPEGYYGDWMDNGGNKTAGSDTNKVQYNVEILGDLSNHTMVINITNDWNYDGSSFTGIDDSGKYFWNEHQYGEVFLYKYDDEAEADYVDGSRITQGDVTTLDGTVYGLYAAEDIIHPDGVTGVIYQAGDLVATATIGKTPITDEYGYLLDIDGNRCIESGKEAATTDTPGVTAFRQVELGKYYISEITEKDGYLTDTTEHRGDELAKYYVTFTYKTETEAVILRDEVAKDDDNNLTMDDDNNTHNVYSGDFVEKQATQFIKMDDLENDSEGIVIEGAGFKIYRIDALTGVVNGTIQPMNGESWTKADMDQFISYDFTNEQTALLYKRDSEAWTVGDTAWLDPTGERENEYTVAEMFTDENGYFITPELPYGQYVLIETTIPDGKVQSDPVLVTISQDSETPQNIRYIQNESVQTYIRIQKTDADSVSDEYDTVFKEGATYRIKLLSDIVDFEKDNDNQVWEVDEDMYLSYKDPYQSGIRVGTAEEPFAVQFIYDPETGTILDAYIELLYRLPIGEYEILEVTAPEGYVVNGSEDTLTDESTDTQNGYTIADTPWAKVAFTVSSDTVYPNGQMGNNKYENTDEYGNLVITIDQENKEQKGIFEITKYGEQLSDAEATGPALREKVETEPFRWISLEEEYDVKDYVFTYELAPVEGATFEVYAAEDIYTQQLDEDLMDNYADDVSHYLVWNKDDLVGTITTDQYGYAYLADLYLGKYYVKEVVAGDGFVLNTTITEFEITSADQDVNFIWYGTEYVNERQKVEVTATKRDADTAEPVGGAIFGLYNKNDIYSYIKEGDVADIPYYNEDGLYAYLKESGNCWLPDEEGTLLIEADTLIATAVTDENGVAKFAVDLPLDDYYIIELEAPVGYTNVQPIPQLDVDATYTGEFGGQDVVTQIHNEETDGLLIVNQKTKHVFTKSDIVSGVLLDGATLQILEINVDEDGNPIKDVDGNYETTLIEEWISDRAEVHYFYESEGGYMIEINTPDDLPEGEELITKYGHLIEGLLVGREYIFREIQAPENYVGYEWSDDETKEANKDENLITEEVRFTVDDTNLVVEHDMKDQRVVGNISITKEGEVVVDTEISILDEIKGFFKTIFEWITGRVANASFEVRVKDTIYTPDNTGTVATYNNGKETVKLVTDALVATITTDMTGVATIEGLPLGTYYIVEVGAGDGDYLLNETVVDVTLSYQGQDVPVVVDDTTLYKNERQRVEIVVTKKSSFESEYTYTNTDEIIPEEEEGLVLAGAVFGLYNAEDITGYSVDPDTGVVTKNPDALIAADTLIEKIATDEEGQAIFTSDLPLGKYYIAELTAPDGYHTSDEIIEVDASYRGQDSEPVIELNYDFYNKPVIIEISKTDIVTGKEVIGATLTVTDSDGNVVDEWVTDGTKHYIKHLLLGETYTLTEVLPGDGYVTANDVTFTVLDTDEDGIVEVQKVEMVDDYTKVIIRKEDIETAESVITAGLELRNEEDEVVLAWTTSEEGEIHILNEAADIDYEVEGGEIFVAYLPIGTYTLYEVVTPFEDGYVTADPMKVVVEDTAEVQNFVMQDDFTKLEISKVDITTKEELPGAHLVITDDEGNVVEEWTSTEETHYIERLPVGDYTLTEISTPDGYVKAESVEFTVIDTGEIQSVIMEDDYTKVEIDKLSIVDGSYVIGAILTIYDADGEVYASWETTEETHRIDRMPVGKYTLVEEYVPDGYLKADSIEFEVLETGEIQKVTMIDDAKVLSIAKVDKETGELISGATMQIQTLDGEVVEEWVTDGTVHYITEMEPGQYLVKEIKAPDGYLLNTEAIPFIITEEKQKIEIVMEDDFIKVEIDKVEAGTDNKLAGATLQLLNAEGEIVAEWISNGESYRIDRLPAGTYTLKEVQAPSGFQVAGSIQIVVEETAEVQNFKLENHRMPPTSSTPETPDTPDTTEPGKTGDTANLVIPAIMMAGSLAGAGLLFFKRKKGTEGAEEE